MCDLYNTDASGCVKSGSEETAIERGWDCFKEEEMACDKVSQEVSQEGSKKLPITISSNGIRITEYIPPQNSAREIPPYGAYTTGECTLSVHTIKNTQQAMNNIAKLDEELGKEAQAMLCEIEDRIVE